MWIYLVAALLATVLAFFACRVRVAACGGLQAPWTQGDKRRWLFLALAAASALPFVVLAGFRYDVGTDYFYTYEPLIRFLQTGVGPIESRVEIGYWLLGKFVLLCGQGITWLLLYSAAFTVLFYWLGIFEQSDIPWLSVWLFAGTRAYFISLNAVRQFMALALALFALRFIKEKCFWKYALCICAGALFHSAALLLLPVYFLRYLKLHPLVGAGLLAAGYALHTPLQMLLRFVVEKTPYAAYLGSVYESTRAVYPEKLVVFLIILCVMSYYYFIDSTLRDDAFFRVSYACQLVMVFIAYSCDLVPLAERISWSLEITHILLIPMLLAREKRRAVRWCVAALLLGAYAYLTYFEIFQNGWHEVIPYRFVFFPEVGFL